jgi:hypothetical protein
LSEHDHDADAAVPQLLETRAQLAELPATIRSPHAAMKNQQQPPRVTQQTVE